MTILDYVWMIEPKMNIQTAHLIKIECVCYMGVPLRRLKLVCLSGGGWSQENNMEMCKQKLRTNSLWYFSCCTVVLWRLYSGNSGGEGIRNIGWNNTRNLSLSESSAKKQKWGIVIGRKEWTRHHNLPGERK